LKNLIYREFRVRRKDQAIDSREGGRSDSLLLTAQGFVPPFSRAKPDIANVNVLLWLEAVESDQLFRQVFDLDRVAHIE